MGHDLDEVKQRGRDIFLFRAPAFFRFGEGVLKAVDAVSAYAYREGKQAGHEAHQDEHHHQDNRNRLVAVFSDNRGWLSNMLTLAVSTSAASGAAVTVGPVISPVLVWGVALLVVLVLVLRALLWPNGGN